MNTKIVIILSAKKRTKWSGMSCLKSKAMQSRGSGGTQQQQEIDYIEEIDGKIAAFEFKWNPNKKPRFPVTFTKTYNPQKTEVINRGNYESFLY